VSEEYTLIIKIKKLEKIFEITLTPEDIDLMFPKVKRNGITINSLKNLLNILPPQPPEPKRKSCFLKTLKLNLMILE